MYYTEPIIDKELNKKLLSKCRDKPNKSNNMSSHYGRYMGLTLQEALQKQQPPKEQLQLYEELQLVRHIAGEALTQYSQAYDAYNAYIRQPNANGKADILYAMMLVKGEQLKIQLHDVAKMCEAASRVESMAKDRFSITQLGYFIDQIVQCIYDSLGEGIKSDKLAQMIRTTITVPSLSTTGTALTPDKDAIDMDESIPADVQPQLKIS